MFGEQGSGTAVVLGHGPGADTAASVYEVVVIIPDISSSNCHSWWPYLPTKAGEEQYNTTLPPLFQAQVTSFSSSFCSLQKTHNAAHSLEYSLNSSHCLNPPSALCSTIMWQWIRNIQITENFTCWTFYSKEKDMTRILSDLWLLQDPLLEKKVYCGHPTCS